MRILFYDQFSLDYGGGGEIWLVNVAQRLARKGISVRVLTTSKVAPGVPLTSIVDMLPEKPRFRIVRLKSITSPLGFPIIKPTELPRFINCIKTSDVIYYIHALPFLEIPILWLSKFWLKKSIIAVYEGPLRPQKVLLRFIRLFTAKLMIKLGICDGHHVLNIADKKLLAGFGARNVRIIPNGTDISRFRRTQDDDSSTKFEVLFVGRLGHQKGFDIFCDIVPEVNSRMDTEERISFRVIGDGPMKTSLQELAKIHENVDHIPFVPNTEIPGYYSKASLLLAPYRYEGQPLAIVEAQACGVPVVASALPGIKEAVIDGETGSLVRNGRARDFVEPILHYYRIWSENPDQYRTIRAKARRNSIRFGWDRITDLVMEFITEIMAGSRSGVQETA